jgi:hypothetical protein
MRSLGYIDGKNIAIEYRSAEGREERLDEIAVKLVRHKVEIIVAPGGAAGLAAKRATQTIPVVYMGGGDPVSLGLVESLARPGGNVTGFTELAPDLTAKRLAARGKRAYERESIGTTLREVCKAKSRLSGRYQLRRRSQSGSEGRMSDPTTIKSAAMRPCRVRGVPTPNKVRINKPRFKAAACSSMRLRIFW